MEAVATTSCALCEHLQTRRRRLARRDVVDHFCTHPKARGKIYSVDPGPWMGYDPSPRPAWCPLVKDER